MAKTLEKLKAERKKRQEEGTNLPSSAVRNEDDNNGVYANTKSLYQVKMDRLNSYEGYQEKNGRTDLVKLKKMRKAGHFSDNYDTDNINNWYNTAQTTLKNVANNINENAYSYAMSENSINDAKTLANLEKESDYINSYLSQNKNSDLSSLYKAYSKNIADYKQKIYDLQGVSNRTNDEDDFNTAINKDSLQKKLEEKYKNSFGKYNLIMDDVNNSSSDEEKLSKMAAYVSGDNEYSNLMATDIVPSKEQIEQYNKDSETIFKAEMSKYDNSTYDELMKAYGNTDNYKEKQYLKNRALEVASSSDLQNEIDELGIEYDALYNGGTDIEKDKRRDEIEAKIDELDNKIKNKKNEEDKQENYSNIILNDVKAYTALQKYYVLQKADETEKLLNDTGASIEDIKTSSAGYYNYAKNLSEDEKDQAVSNFENLKNQGYDVDKLYKYFSREQEEKLTGEQNKILTDYAKEHPVLGSVASVGLNLGGGVADAAKYIGTEIDSKFNNGDGYINPQNTNVYRAQMVRDTVSEDMGGLGKFLYSTGMSMADFLSTAAISAVPGGQAVGLALLGTSAGVSAANDVIESGGDIDHAVMTGLAAGIAETVFEKVSLEQLKAFKQSDVNSVKDFVKNLIKGSFTEGSEEAFTDMANAITDQIINGDMSQLSQQYNEYLASGMSEREAWWQTALGFGEQTMLDFSGGALSGGVMSGGAMAINVGGKKVSDALNGADIKENSQSFSKDNKNVNLESDSVNNLISKGKSYSEDTQAYRLAAKLEKQAAKKGDSSKVSNLKLGQLRNAIIEESSKSIQSIRKNVIDKAVKDNKDTLTSEEKDIIKKIENNTQLTDKDYDVIDNSKVLTNLDKAIFKATSEQRNNLSDAVKATHSPLVDVKGTDLTDYDSSKSDNDMLKQWASDMELNENETENFINGYDPQSMSLKSYAYTYNIYNNYGKFGVMYDEINADNIQTDIDNTVRINAYKSGLNYRKSYYQTQNALTVAQQELRKRNGGYAEGIVDVSAIKNETVTAAQKKEIKYLEALAQVTGLNVKFVASHNNSKGYINSPNGSYNRATNTITIDINSMKKNENASYINGAMLYTASHELTHVAELNTDTYEALHSAVVSAIGNDNWERLIAKHTKDISKSRNTKSMKAFEINELASNEALAEACSQMLQDSNLISQVADENPSLAKKIINILKGFIENLRKRIRAATNLNVEEVELLKKGVDNLEEIKGLWETAVKEGIKNANAKANTKNNTADNSDVKNQLRAIPEENEITNNIKTVANMKPVVTLKGSEFSKSNADLVTQVTKYFDDIGGYVNTDCGKIELTKKGVKSSIGHGIGRNKAIAFKAVPNVLKEGKIIDFQKNWKNRGYDTAVFAAPIKIANKDYFMAAVIVVETERNSYYLHEVAIQEKEDNTLFKTGTVKNGTSGKVLSSPIFTLLQKLQSVKNELSGKEKSLPTTADAKSPASTSETNSGTASKNSISNATENVNNDNTKYQSRNTDIDDEYLEAVENNDLEAAQKLVDEAAKVNGYTIKRFKEDNVDIRYQERDNDVISNRELLSNALLSVAKTGEEKANLQAYQEGIAKINEDTARLNNINRQIKEISFTKGSDRSQLAKLKNQKEILTKRINRYDKALLKLEGMDTINRILDVEKAKVKKKLGEKYNARYYEQKAQFREQLKQQKIDAQKKTQKAKDRRDTSTTINKIKKFHKKLIQMSTKPTDNNYIPVEIVDSGVYKAILDLTTSTINDEGTEIGKKLMKINQTLSKLISQYDTNGDYAAEVNNSDMLNQVTALANMLEGKNLRRKTSTNPNGITLGEAEDIYVTVKSIYDGIKSATKQIGRDERISNAESGHRIIEEINRVKKGKSVSSQARSFMLSAMRTIDMYCGYNQNAELNKHANRLNKGVRTRNYFQMECEKRFNALTDNNRKAYKRSLQEAVVIKYIQNNGEIGSIKISRMQGLQILMSWEREMHNDKLVHMQTGGIKIANLERLIKGKSSIFSEAQEVRVNQSLINAISKTMTDFELQYKHIAEEYFNMYSKDAINEVSRLLKHRDIATEDYYIPFTTDSDFLIKELSDLKYDATIEGMGMLKTLSTKAQQPIQIVGLNNVINRHIADTAKYYGLAIPTRNFKRAMNIIDYTENVDPKNMSKDAKIGKKMMNDSVRHAISSKWGDNAVRLINRMIADLEAPRVNYNNVFDTVDRAYNALQSGFVNATLTSNISVIMKQAASYPTAGAYLSGGSLAKGLKDINKILGKGWRATCDEIDAHTAQHYMRRIGMSQEEIANMLNSKLGNLPTPLNPTKWIQAVDCATTALLWHATKEEINTKYRKAKKEIGTNEYWQDVTSLYDKIIEDTQPMYDSLHRSEAQKQTNAVFKALFMFKTQPMQNTGILIDAVSRCKANPNKDNANILRKAIFSQISSLATFSTMTFIAAALLHKWDKYRDDEDDEVTAQSIITRILWDMLGNTPALIAPIGGSEIYSLISSIIEGDDWYGLEIPVLEEIGDTVTAFQQCRDTIENTIGMLEYCDEADFMPLFENACDFLGQIASMFGVPYDNAKNLLNSGKSYLNDIFSDNSDPFEKSNSEYAESYDKAYLRGDKEKAKKIIDNFYNKKLKEHKAKKEANPKKYENTTPEKKAKAAVRDALKNKYKIEYQKAFLKNDEDKKKEIVSLLRDSGYMTWDNKTLSMVLAEWASNSKEDIKESFAK